MARQRGAIAGGYKCGICRERGHNAVTCPNGVPGAPAIVRRIEAAITRGGGFDRMGPIGQRPELAPLAYVLDSLEMRLQDRPRGRAFVVSRGWLKVLIRAARKSAA